MPESMLRLVLVCSCLLVGTSSLLAQQHTDLPPSHSVKPELYATGFEFAEGPALDAEGNLFVVNYRYNGTIGRISKDGTASIWCDLEDLVPLEGRNPQANGIKLDPEGRLIVADAGAGRLLRISADGTQAEVLADRCEGMRFQSINDVALDARGNTYFTDPGGSSIENSVGSFYRYDIATKKTERLDTGLAFPNGLAVTPDQKHLCVAESQRYRILIYTFNEEGGIGLRRTLINFPTEDAGEIRGGKFDPDGMVFDAKGRLYVGMWTGGVVNVIEVPSGKLIRQYDAGGSKATNCHFFGSYLYTTVAAKEAVFRLKLGVDGFSYNKPR